MKKNLWLLIVILIFVNIRLFNSNKTSNNLEITVLDVGQGDSMLIKTPTNSYGLIDTGIDTNILNAIGNEMTFFYKDLDFIVLTHPDADHIEGVIELIKRYKVKKIFINDTSKTNSLLEEIKIQISKNDIENFELNYLNDFIIDGVKFNILWPTGSSDILKIDNPNNASISILISYNKFHMVSMGDLEAREEILATGQKYFDTDILKISHHGSKTSTSQKLLDLTKPEIAIISAGINNRFGHPTSEVVNLLGLNKIKIFRTDIDGSIKIIIDNDGNYKVLKNPKPKTQNPK